MNTQTTTTATAYQVKTIDINCKQWFDKVNGNSYFAGSITLNFGQPDAITLNMPFQYGYGDFYKYEALETLQVLGYITVTHTADLREHGIIVRSNIQRGCKKRELMQY
jgi:hypothetical protein